MDDTMDTKGMKGACGKCFKTSMVKIFGRKDLWWGIDPLLKLQGKNKVGDRRKGLTNL